MIKERGDMNNVRLQVAIEELQALILSRFPTTTFMVGEADDPDGVYMRAIVDVDDTDEVIEVFLDRLVDFQVDEELPINVVPVRTPERMALNQEREERARVAVPLQF